MDNRSKFWRGVMVGVLVTAFACLVTVGTSAGIYMFGRRVIDNQVQVQAEQGNSGAEANAAGQAGNEKIDMERVNRKIGELQSLIDKKYLFEDKIEVGKEESGIYSGFLYGLNDPYAVYYTPEELASFMDETNGSYCGIGAMVSQNQKTGISTIIRVFEDSPAEKAGIRPGDVIFAVGDTEVTGMDLTIMVNNYIKGEEGTDVSITVYREEENEYVDLTVTRKPVDVQTVSGKMLSDEIGYISVIEFDKVTDAQFKGKIEELTSQGMKKMIVDLRNNPGGELNTVVSMADYILEDKGRILTVADKNGAEEVYNAEDGHSLDIPIAVLVNGNSASASEVFTGALKDYEAATIVGTQTFGKGIVQTLFPLSDGSAVKLTTNHYYTPSGLDIHGKGITPDVEVELDEEAAKMPVLPEEMDNQLQEAIGILEGK
ncbi:S41 family peptidase [uncultured Clostridium sp.]|uniref:S41 family peptidase n=1 Tax=uncultured Clostridium sp. TaxID=59620 RepID=UPI0025DEA724|nr:S41 family peptidase [uncultured Clostridium sp.]